MTQDIYGVWLTNVDSEVLFSRENLQSAIQELSSMGFNTLYPVVWNSGYTLYPSKLTKKLIDIEVHPGFKGSFQGRDMLAEIIEIGHQYNLKVIPWFEYGLTAYNGAGDDPWSKKEKWLLKDRKNPNKKYFDIHKPEVRVFFTTLVAEMLMNYDGIDGIQFDDHFGINENAVLENKQETSNVITELWQTLFYTIKSISNGKCTVALSPNEWAKDNLQNWELWVQDGFVEQLMFQLYEDYSERLDKENFDKLFDNRLEEKIVNKLNKVPITCPVGVGIHTGSTQFSPLLNKLKVQIDVVRKYMNKYSKIQGLSFFFYESLWHKLSKDENGDLIKEFLEERKLYFEKEFMS